jgi:hypothetical protein
MKNYPNIESRKNRITKEYTGYGGGHVWHIWKTTWKGWIASSNTATFTVKGRILDDISAKLASLSRVEA